MKKLAVIVALLALLGFAGTYEWTVDLGQPQTDMEVALAGRRAVDLIRQGYVVYVAGTALTMSEAEEMAEF